MLRRLSLALASVTGCLILFPAAWPRPVMADMAGAQGIAGAQTQSSSSTQNPASKSYAESKPDREKPALDSFVGTVTKSGDKFVLKTMDHGTYQLDDQQRVQRFCGRVVQVMGTLDAHRNTIQVQGIKGGGG